MLRATLAVGCTLVAIATLIDTAGAATKRFRVEPPEVVVDEPIWICLVRGAPPSEIEIEQAGVTLPGEEQQDTGTRLRLSVEFPAVGPLELNARVRQWRSRESGASGASTGELGAGVGEASRGLAPGTYVLSAEGFEPETLQVRKASPAASRDYALLRRIRFHLSVGDSARAARLLRDFLARSRNPSAIVEAKLELLSVLPLTEYAERPKLWLAEWVARHHQDCVVGAGIERWLTVVSPEEGRAALREVATAYVGTRASVVSQELLRRGSAIANDSSKNTGND